MSQLQWESLNKISLFFSLTIVFLVIGLFLGLSFFVFAQDSSDVIGVRVFANPDHLSPVKWYERNVPNPGAPILIEVDGYEAVKDGRTIYINGANTVVPGEAGCPGSATQDCIYTNIYVISYSEGASADTAQIFQQMLDNFELNINLANIQACGSDETTTTYYCTESHEPCANQAVCTASDPSETNLCQIIPCSTDIDCRYLDDNPLCGAKKDKLRRDTKRLSDVQELVERVDDYKSTTGELPRLQAGTYLEKHSFSAWPSWQATLGNELGVSLLLDPLNQFIGCRSPCCDEGSCLPGVACPEAETCWDPEGLLLGCPEDAYLYGYGYDDVSDTARLYYNVEYREAAWYTNPLSGVGVGDILTILSEQKCLGGSRHGLSCVGGCPGGECVDYCFGYQGAVTDDYDGDGYPDATDNCPRTWNDPQTDTDLDGVGDVCDPCPDSGDVDGDGFPDNDNDTDGYCEGASYHYPKVGGGDNCPFDYNPAQNPDACSLCIDLDNDTHCENGATPDNCPGVYNDPQTDTDSDGLGDACDICLFDKFNDSDDDGVCGLYDSDGDGISDSIDNCPVNYNPGQEDFDSDADLVNCNYNVDGDLHLINDSPPYCSGGAVALPTGDCPAGSSLCGGNACDEQYCGNGIIDAGEQCDGTGGDGSSATQQYLCVNCQTAGGYCGDGDIQFGFEACDCGDPIEYSSGSVTGSYCLEGAPFPVGDGLVQDPAGTDEDNQYLCLNNCQEWAGGWCGDAQIQDGTGDAPFDVGVPPTATEPGPFESCEGSEGGDGTGPTDLYGCSRCNKTGGYCGDGTIQDWHGEGCDGNLLGGFKGISIEHQYFCTCTPIGPMDVPPYDPSTCPTKVCQQRRDLDCTDDIDCGSDGPCEVYDSMCMPTGGWCGDGEVQTGYGEECENDDPIYDYDIVFFFDTSGSMGDEAAAFCGVIDTIIADLEINVGLTVRYAVYGIHDGTISGILENDCGSYIGNIDPIFGVSLHLESWGPSYRVIAENYPWLEGYERVIVAFSDEAPMSGDGWSGNYGDSPAAIGSNDWARLADGINGANENNVIANFVGCSRTSPLSPWSLTHMNNINSSMAGAGGIAVSLSGGVSGLACQLGNIFRAILCHDDSGVMNCSENQVIC